MRYADVGVVLSAALIAGCTTQQAPAATTPKLDQAAATAVVTAQVNQIIGILTKKDADGVSTAFTDDGVWILPDATTMKGKDAIKTGAAAFFTSFDSVTAMTQTVDKVIVVSDSELVSFATGKYTIFLKGKKTGEAHVNPYSDYWKKGSDGTWRIAYEVNAEGPANPPPPAPAAAAKKS